MLDKMKNDQRKARRCGFHDNIAAIMFGDDKQKKKRKSEVRMKVKVIPKAVLHSSQIQLVDFPAKLKKFL